MAELPRFQTPLLGTYLRELRRYSVIDGDEQHAIAVRYRETGDPRLVEKLVTTNLRLVVKIAREYHNPSLSFLDLIQEGNLGLIQGVKHYDPDRGVKLASYAAWWIRAYILRSLVANHRLVKLGTTQKERRVFFNLKKEREKLEREGVRAEDAVLAERLAVEIKTIEAMEQRMAAPEQSLDAPVRMSGDMRGLSAIDLLAAPPATQPDVCAEENELSSLLRERLDQFKKGLGERDRTILEARWLAPTPCTLKDLGMRFGVSRERARQIEERLLCRLGTHLGPELSQAVA